METKPKRGRPPKVPGNATVRVQCCVNADTASRINKARGDVPVSEWIRAVIRAELNRVGV